VAAFGGSFSAEHGIGALKRDELARTQVTRGAGADAADQAALDPLGLLNPGRVL
jgi:FAD/FMN-containing dehydrogenase